MKDHYTRDADAEIVQLIREAGSRPVPGADRAARVRAAVELEWRAETRARRLRLLLRLTGGGTAMLAAAATLFLVVHQPSTVAPAAPLSASIARVAAVNGPVSLEIAGNRAAVGQTIAPGSPIRTDGKSQTTVTFSDGAELRVDKNTAATLVDARTIHLEHGAIYLDSGASTGSFTVTTASGTIRDIGTRFEVRTSPLRQGSGGQGNRDRQVVFSVKVRDGAVQLEREGRIERAETGTAFVVYADGRELREAVAPFAKDWAWTTAAAPPFIVNGAKLEAFLEWAAREGGWTIEWTDELRQKARMTTLKDPTHQADGMTPAGALDLVLPTCELSPDFDNNGRLRLKPYKGIS
jgi:ferric-dicitrate binding protein FerR (iron transport regulator)